MTKLAPIVFLILLTSSMIHNVQANYLDQVKNYTSSFISYFYKPTGVEENKNSDLYTQVKNSLNWIEKSYQNYSDKIIQTIEFINSIRQIYNIVQIRRGRQGLRKFE